MKKAFDYIKKARKTETGRAKLFLMSFGFLLFVLVIIARVGPKHPVSEQLEAIRNANKGQNGVELTGLLRLNFEYKYTINIDNNKYYIVGKMCNTGEEYNCRINNKINKYYRNASGLYRFDNMKWIESAECDKFYKFYNLAYIKYLIENSSIDYNTHFNDGRVDVSLLISVNTINKIINNKETDYSDDPSNIKISYDKDGNVSNISYNLNSYCKLMKLCKNNLNIELEYKNIGNVSELENPLES